MFIIPTLYRAIDGMSAVQAKIAAGNQLIGTSATIAGAKMERSLTAISTKAMAVGRTAGLIGVGLAVPLGLAAKAAMDFDKQMTNVSTLVDTTKENMDAMGQRVLAIAQKSPVAIHDLTESLYQIRSAGIGAADAMNVLQQSTKLGVAGLGTTVESANMITSAMNVFKRESLDAATAADVMFKTVAGGKTKIELLAPEFGKAALAASDVGVSFKELMAMTAAMTNTGVQTAEAQTAITQAMISLNKRTSDMIEIQQKLSGQMGITGQEFINFAGGAVGAMKMIDEYATKNRLDLFKIYGRKEGALADIALTRLQKQAFADLFETMKGGKTIDEAYNKQAATSAANWERLKNNVQVLGIQIGTLLLPAVIMLANAMISIVKPLADWGKNHKTLAGILIKTIGLVAVLALGVSVISFTIGAATKALWLWQAAMVAANTISTIFLALTGSNTAGIYAETWALKAETLALGGYNAAMMSVVATASKLAITLMWVYGIWKLFDKKQQAASKMDIITQHLPEGVDKQKFTDQFQDILSPGHISLFNRLKGVKSYYPQELYDSLEKKYATPEAMEAQQNSLPLQSSNETSNKTISHEVNIMVNGKTVSVLNSNNLMPTTTSTSVFS